jgi:hypothetical protein
MMFKLGCLDCSVLPVIEVGDGDLNRPIQEYGERVTGAQADLPVDDSDFQSVGDDLKQLLIAAADFEAHTVASLKALAAGNQGQRPMTELVHDVLLEAGLSVEIKHDAQASSACSQYSRLAASRAWAAVHPGGDLAWEHRYLRAFLESVAAQLYGGLPPRTRCIYQLRQTPPAVLFSVRSTEFREAGGFATSVFCAGGRQTSNLAEDQDILSFQSWCLAEAVRVDAVTPNGDIPFVYLPHTEQVARLERYKQHLCLERQEVATKVLQKSAPQQADYVRTMLSKCISGPVKSCHTEHSPFLQQVAAASRANKVIDMGEGTQRCTCRPNKSSKDPVGRGNPRLVSMRFSTSAENVNQHTNAIGGFRRGRAMISVNDVACKMPVRGHVLTMIAAQTCGTRT